MDKILNVIKKVKHWKIVLGIIAVLMLIAASFLMNNVSSMIDALPEQQAAQRWGGATAQLSAYFAVDLKLEPENFLQTEGSIRSDYENAAIEIPDEDSDARFSASCYSSKGTLTLESENASAVSCEAFGVGGDFFLFHQMDTLSGALLVEDQFNDDYIVLDEAAAWKLFGSADVVGKQVQSGDIPFIVSGVVKIDDSSLMQMAGYTPGMVIVSYDKLKEIGSTRNISTYEILLPNPVKDYAAKVFKEHIGVSDDYVEIVENSTRFSYENRYRIFKEGASRVMTGKPVIYPYWENLARAVENRVMIYTAGALIFAVLSIIIFVILFLEYWFRKPWTLEDKIKEAIDELLECIRVYGILHIFSRNGMREEDENDENKN